MKTTYLNLLYITEQIYENLWKTNYKYRGYFLIFNNYQSFVATNIYLLVCLVTCLELLRTRNEG